MKNFSLAWRLARRELRGGLTGFRVFLACLALGVGAIAAVGWSSSAIIGGLRADAKQILGGDIELRIVHRTATSEESAYLSQTATKVSQSIVMRAMAISTIDTDKRTLIQLKAVDDLYPLEGMLKSTPAMSIKDALALHDGVAGALVDPNLLDKMSVQIGDLIRVGKAQFLVSGTIDKEPDRVSSMVNFGPRLMISTKALQATGLVQPGSLIQYYYKLELPFGMDTKAWREDLTTKFPDAGWRIRGTDEAAPGVRRFIDRLTLFMSFVGYTVLLVGGVGITRAVTAYLESKTRTIAALKCLGADTKLIVSIYLLQLLCIAAIGIVIGVVGGIALPAALLGALADTLPVRPALALYPNAIMAAAAFGVVIAITAALWPIGRARQVSPRDLFRAAAQPLAQRPPMFFMAWIGAGVAVLATLVFVTATDPKFALWFILGVLATFGLLRLTGTALIAVSRHFKPGNALLRLVLANVHRPGSAAHGVILSLGLGLSVLVAVIQIEGNVSKQISERLPDEAPAYFFIDIQSHQVAEFDRIVASIDGVSGLIREPVVRGRIVEINGVAADPKNVPPESQWALRGDRAFTSTAEMKPDTQITAGAWWASDYSGPPMISLDDSLARGFGVDVGDTLTINVLGREITAEIASLRDIDWGSLRFDFAVVLSPGILEGAPHSHIAAANATPDAEKILERAVTDAFDNVSAVQVREALQAAADLLEGIGGAIRSVAGITVIAGAIVLAGALAAGQRRRTFDAVVFKVLGATRRRIALMFVLEYGVLGLITGLAAVGVGSLASWGVITFLMGMEWIWLPLDAGMTVALALAATIGFGLAGSWRILGMRTALYLRND